MAIITVAITPRQQTRSNRPKLMALARLMGESEAPKADLVATGELLFNVFITFYVPWTQKVCQ